MPAERECRGVLPEGFLLLVAGVLSVTEEVDERRDGVLLLVLSWLLRRRRSVGLFCVVCGDESRRWDGRFSRGDRCSLRPGVMLDCSLLGLGEARWRRRCGSTRSATLTEFSSVSYFAS